MKNFVFKSLEEKDLNTVMEIEKSAFSQSTWEEAEVYRERIECFPQGNLGIWYNDILSGFICSEIWDGENSYDKNRFMLSHKIEKYHSYEGTELYISSFALDRSLKGRGLGKLAFDEFLELMRKKYDLKSSILLVSEEWQGAIKIYENNNYKIVDRIDKFFQNHEDKNFNGIIMKKYFR